MKQKTSSAVPDIQFQNVIESEEPSRAAGVEVVKHSFVYDIKDFDEQLEEDSEQEEERHVEHYVPIASRQPSEEEDGGQDANLNESACQQLDKSAPKLSARLSVQQVDDEQDTS